MSPARRIFPPGHPSQGGQYDQSHLIFSPPRSVLAGCSSAAQGAPNTAVVTQSGPDFVESYDAPPAYAPELDGAPPIVPPPIAPTCRTACAGAAPPAVVQKVKARFSCDIDIDRTSNGIRVTPIIRADKSMAGEYSLVITKSGASGSSDISQGGPFDAARGERVRLERVGILDGAGRQVPRRSEGARGRP